MWSNCLSNLEALVHMKIITSQKVNYRSSQVSLKSICDQDENILNEAIKKVLIKINLSKIKVEEKMK